MYYVSMWDLKRTSVLDSAPKFLPLPVRLYSYLFFPPILVSFLNVDNIVWYSASLGDYVFAGTLVGT